METIERCIRLNGTNFVRPRRGEGLGFKEIENFNDALLAKQVWHMINNLDSLCHRVFKARFFPDSSILEASDFTCGSYAWKSIINARDVI